MHTLPWDMMDKLEFLCTLLQNLLSNQTLKRGGITNFPWCNVLCNIPADNVLRLKKKKGKTNEKVAKFYFTTDVNLEA